jgi:hypothetical protein
MNKQYHHDTSADNSQNATNTLIEANSCTSCHNPHLDWTEQNPNLLKDHYVYTHNQEDSVTPKIIDSLDRTRAGKTAPSEGLYLMEIYY